MTPEQELEKTTIFKCIECGLSNLAIKTYPADPKEGTRF